jgi:hypothetical protein
MPLTHVCKGLIAGDIIRDGRIEPAECSVFGRSLAYFFYGRPAFRVKGDGPIRNYAACPFCFIFDPRMIDRAHAIHAFDTGAFGARLYSHVIMDEMQIEDFSLERKADRPNRLIKAVFGNRKAYFDGDTMNIPDPASIAPAGEFLVRTYIDLVKSVGRNEPDDRVGSIEVTFGDPVPLNGNLLAVVVPDILWNDKDKANWLAALSGAGVKILPFHFLQGREPEHHHATMEVEIRNYFTSREDL